MEMCASYLEQGIFNISVEFAEIGILGNAIGILENLGFLVSTETSKDTLIRVNGHMNSVHGEHFFCVKDGCHD